MKKMSLNWIRNNKKNKKYRDGPVCLSKSCIRTSFLILLFSMTTLLFNTQKLNSSISHSMTSIYYPISLPFFVSLLIGTNPPKKNKNSPISSPMLWKNNMSSVWYNLISAIVQAIGIFLLWHILERCIILCEIGKFVICLVNI